MKTTFQFIEYLQRRIFLLGVMCVMATNAQLVEKAATIVTNMGCTLMTPAEVREKLQLQKRAPVTK